MENKILEQMVVNLKEFKRQWGLTLKETSRKERFFAYKKNILTKIELILAGRNKEDKYLKDIEENCEEIYKISELDLLDKYSKETVKEPEKEPERKSPLI